MYEIAIRARAERDSKALPAAVQKRVIEAIQRLRENPRPPGIKKLAPPGGYRIRVGDYRIVLEIEEASQMVIVTRVRHRREVYRDL
jgi:mRNA interferase RelE/StbE